MKTLVLVALMSFAAVAVQAKTIKSDAALTINPASVDQNIRLVTKDEPGSSLLKVSIIVTDEGMSTDVSPRHNIILTFASLAEMGNITTSFLITDQAYKFISAKRKAAGIYEIKTHVYDERGMVEITETLDTTQMFIDEKKLRNNCGDGFCDTDLNTSIESTETVKILH